MSTCERTEREFFRVTREGLANEGTLSRDLRWVRESCSQLGVEGAPGRGHRMSTERSEGSRWPGWLGQTEGRREEKIEGAGAISHYEETGFYFVWNGMAAPGDSE